MVSTERIGRDLSKSWLPITAVISILGVVIIAVWWLAGEHASLIALAKDLEVSKSRDAECRVAIAEQAKVIAALDKAQATILANLEAIRTELQRNSVLLEDLRRRP